MVYGPALMSLVTVVLALFQNKSIQKQATDFLAMFEEHVTSNEVIDV
jgi:hypothetical protein